MALPKLTPEQREHALARAVTLPEVMKMALTSEVIGKMRASELLAALPGMGKVRATQAMERLGIAEGRRLRGLGSAQRAALLGEFAPAGA